MQSYLRYPKTIKHRSILQPDFTHTSQLPAKAAAAFYKSRSSFSQKPQQLLTKAVAASC